MGLSLCSDSLLMGGWAWGVVGGNTNKQRPQLGWVPQEASTFIDACSGSTSFLVSLLVREGGPAKEVQAIDGA